MIDTEKLKQHWEENKKLYYGIAAGLVVGGVTVYLLKGRPQIINMVAPEIKPVFNNVNDLGGRMVKVVQNLETKEIFESITAAAEHEGVTTSWMSRLVHGYAESSTIDPYKVLCLSTI